MNKKGLQNRLWFLHGFLIIILCVGWYQFGITIQNNDACAEGLNYIEYLNSSVQRLAKLEMLESPNDELVYHLNNVIGKLDANDVYGQTISVDDTVTNSLIDDIQSNWEALYEAVKQVRDGEDASELLFASERFYNTAIQLTIETSTQFTGISKHLYHIQLFLMVIIILMISLVVVNIYNIIKELRNAKLLSEKMFIDVSTGLFNRSKCQEMLKNTITPENSKSRIMIMIDLNDLKRTNDNLGHQVGDELIANFAEILKNASNVHNFEIFIGRYGGDEFMIYYPSADEADALLYIEETEYLCDQFNMKEERYQVSFAAGYAVFGTERSDATMRDLFNEADANMYVNKVTAKEKRRAHLMSQNCSHEIVVDERLMPSSDSRQVITDVTYKGGE